MGFTPTYRESHLVVAAVRILEHTTGKSPNPDQIAELAGLGHEKVHVLVHELAARKILRVLKTPFDVRVDVLDPKPLEELPEEDTGPGVSEEIAEFTERSKEKQREMERMLRGGEAEKRRKERVAKLEEHFKSFKPKKGELESLFGASGSGGGTRKGRDPFAGDASGSSADDADDESADE